MLIIWPVIHFDLSSSKYWVSWAISFAVPILFKGCLAAAFSILSSVFKNLFARGVLTIDGAMQLTLIFGANSAASYFVNPSSADFEEDTEEWKGIPVLTATVL